MPLPSHRHRQPRRRHIERRLRHQFVDAEITPLHNRIIGIGERVRDASPSEITDELGKFSGHTGVSRIERYRIIQRRVAFEAAVDEMKNAAIYPAAPTATQSVASSGGNLILRFQGADNRAFGCDGGAVNLSGTS